MVARCSAVFRCVVLRVCHVGSCCIFCHWRLLNTPSQNDQQVKLELRKANTNGSMTLENQHILLYTAVRNQATGGGKAAFRHQKTCSC